MISEEKLREFTIKLIGIVVWFEILWAVVFVVALVFQWSGLTDQLTMAFFSSGFCGIVVLLALAILNITANLNIISKSQVVKASTTVNSSKEKISTVKTLGVAFGLILIVVLSLWFAEYKLHQVKISENETKLESLSDSNLMNDALNLIDTNGISKDLHRIVKNISASIELDGRVSIIFPLNGKSDKNCYEITAWWYGGKESSLKLSEANLTKFVPRPKERSRFNKLKDGNIESFSLIKTGDELRTFRRYENNSTYAILLIDTSRRSAYQRGSY